MTAGYVVPGGLSKKRRMCGVVAGMCDTLEAKNEMPARMAPARLISSPVDLLTVFGNTI